MASYLITGGAGFIGSHLAQGLLAAGHRLTILDDLSTGRTENLPEAATFIEGSITDGATVETAFRGAEGCFHLAAVASVQKYRDGWSDAADINLLGSVRVFETAARHRVPVVYASSAAVYGDTPTVPLSETMPPKSISGYGADKLGCELHAAAMSEALGLSAFGMRFFNVFGPRQQPGSPYSGVISIFLDRLIRGLPLTVFGDGSQVRDFVYVTDVAAALMRAMDRARAGQSGVLNVCRGEAVSLLDLIAILADILGVSPVVEHAAARAGDIRVSLGDPTAARARLGFAATVSMAEGLRATADWMRAAD